VAKLTRYARVRLRRVAHTIWIFAWSKRIDDIHIKNIDEKFRIAMDRWDRVIYKEEKFNRKGE
jgi:hypothetical protein